MLCESPIAGKAAFAGSSLRISAPLRYLFSYLSTLDWRPIKSKDNAEAQSAQKNAENLREKQWCATTGKCQRKNLATSTKQDRPQTKRAGRETMEGYLFLVAAFTA